MYQIYPRSFRDSDGDGVGDLRGVRAQLSYLSWLGVDALWLSPIFPSPMRDFGYDVADFVGVDAVFGSLEDFDDLVGAAHEVGLRVVLDWVPNHTSIDHPWFVEARRSRSSEHRDWYLWRDGVAGGPPNNWVRAWSDQPAWTWDDETDQYYLHCFLPSQPDLNWENVRVRGAMHQTLRFWLDRGVDGIRMDVVHLLGKELTVDDAEELRMLSHVPLNDVASTHGYLREIRAVLDDYDGDRVSIGEVYLLDPDRVADYYGDGDELHLSFNFAPLHIGWRADAWRDVIVRTQAALEPRDAWPTWVLSNHDTPRIATRLHGDEQRVRSAMVLLLSLRGTPFLFAGEELGLEDAVIPEARVVDPGGRDGCRAPIPWTIALDHGWPGVPWLPFAEYAGRRSVEAQRDDGDSMLSLTRRVIELRRTRTALRHGTMENVQSDGRVLSFDRMVSGERLRVTVNFSREEITGLQSDDHVLLSSRRHRGGLLAAGEAVICEVKS